MHSRKLVHSFPNSSALAWEIAKRFEGRDRRVLLLPSLEDAQSLSEELSVFSDASKIYILAPLETNLLKHRGPSAWSRNQRNLFLARMATGFEALSYYLIPVEGLIQRFPRADFYAEHTLSLSLGIEITRASLVDRLSSIGYLPTELVEQEGQFAARGSIVDVFPLGSELPLRLELFDDVVSSMRLFHPDSQRMISEITEQEIHPVRDFLLDATRAKPERLTKIKEEIYQSSLPGEDREFLIDRLRNGHLFPTIDYWAAEFLGEGSEDPGRLLSTVDAVIDPSSIVSYVSRFHSEFSKDLKNADENHHWVPAAEKFLNSVGPLQSLVENATHSASLLFSVRGSTASFVQDSVEAELARYAGIVDLERRLSDLRNHASDDLLSPLRDFLLTLGREEFRVFIVGSSSTQLDRVRFLLEAHSVHAVVVPELDWRALTAPGIYLGVGSIENGFIDQSRKICLIPEHQIFGSKRKRDNSRYIKSKSHLPELGFADLEPGNIVVHSQHGVGRYHGLKMMTFSGIPAELLELEYRDGAKLFVPVNKISQISKFSGENSAIPLDKLGGASWEQKKQKTKKELQSIAGDLLHLYSLRDLAKGPELQLLPEKIEAFAASFPFEETRDQQTAIEATLADLKNQKPMDRLVCGDVGYGKTEVALRAAHAVASCGFQVAVLAPTTLLATQHEGNFRRRLAPFGIRVEGISRLKAKKETQESLKSFSEGKIDVLIGTHRLLSKDFSHKNLGLLVVDEEQKFGVTHKERLKQLKHNVHVLTLTATPIPRTLNMAIAGIKDLSIITTPPQDRLSVKTHIVKKSMAVIQQAIEEEVARGGQVFYVHNRVQSIQREYEEILRACPKISADFVHGQMDETQLEERMIRFYEGKIQVLIATSIIESGLDIPNANTLIVDRADHFGLSQLYQIRGRVGRSNVRAFAYFLLPEHSEITRDAEKRLEVLEAYQELGSGFHIASHDLEIRGTGDLLGRDQSGHIAAIGLDTYLELLQECVAELRGEHFEASFEPEIQLPIDTTIPPSYIPESNIRLSFYRKLSSALSEAEVDAILDEMNDRFGSPGPSVDSLGVLMRIKCQLRRLKIRSATAGRVGVSLAFDSTTPISSTKLVSAVTNYPSHFQINPEGRLLIKNPVLGENQTQTDVLRRVEGALAILENWVETKASH